MLFLLRCLTVTKVSGGSRILKSGGRINESWRQIPVSRVERRNPERGLGGKAPPPPEKACVLG